MSIQAKKTIQEINQLIYDNLPDKKHILDYHMHIKADNPNEFDLLKIAEPYRDGGIIQVSRDAARFLNLDLILTSVKYEIDHLKKASELKGEGDESKTV